MGKAEVTQLDISSLTFLCVDDNKNMRRIIRSILGAFGVRRVLEAEDGVTALEILEQEPIDFILLDWEMPIMDGPEFVKAIRNPDHIAAYTPLFMITGYTTRKRIVQASRMGVHEVLCKPLSAARLYERIVATIASPRPFLRMEGYFGPEPRQMKKAPGKPRPELIEEPREQDNEPVFAPQAVPSFGPEDVPEPRTEEPRQEPDEEPLDDVFML